MMNLISVGPLSSAAPEIDFEQEVDGMWTRPIEASPRQGRAGKPQIFQGSWDCRALALPLALERAERAWAEFA